MFERRIKEWPLNVRIKLFHILRFSKKKRIRVGVGVFEREKLKSVNMKLIDTHFNKKKPLTNYFALHNNN